MKKFRWKTYTLASEKIKKSSGPIRFCFLSDLHGSVFGEKNEELLAALDGCRPDGIFVGGDGIVGKPPVSYEAALAVFGALAARYPLWYAPGNHESRVKRHPERYGTGYEKYERRLKAAGVQFLYNDTASVKIRGSRFYIHGLELGERYFQKPFVPKLPLWELRRLMGEERRAAGYHVLLAHNPKYARTYFAGGSDLILSGHYHGGILRLGEHHGLAAPQGLFLPRYCCGDFYRGSQAMIVSAGLGEHTLPLRIHNPREVIEIVINGQNGG